MRRYWLILMAVLIVSLSAGQVMAMTAQESTQLRNHAQLIKQLTEQAKMVRNQYQMLQKLTGEMAGDLSGANMEILELFRKMQDAWLGTKGLTHTMDDFMDKHNERHPTHEPGTIVNVEEERRRRDQERLGMIEAYLKGLNIYARDFENREALRQKLYDVLQGTDGQLQAIQALGGVINQISTAIEAQTQILSASVMMAAEKELDKDALADNEKKNTEAAAQAARDHKPSGRKFNPLDW